MSLTPYTITALEASAVNSASSGKNIVAGAVCSLYSQPSDAVVILYDDAAGSNGSTTKVTGTDGQVVVYVPQGRYRLSVNGSDSFVTVAADAPVDFDTFANLELATNTQDYQKLTCRERANANYILQLSGYVALAGDATLANGRVAALQDLENARSYGTIVDGVDCSAVIELALNSGRSNIYDFTGDFKVNLPTTTTGINNLTLDCAGAYFDCSDMYGSDTQNTPDALFTMTGPRILTTTITADVAEGTKVINVASATGIASGMVLRMKTDQHWYTEAVSIGRYYIGEVATVVGTVVTMQEPLELGFTFSGFTIEVNVYNPIEDIKLKGGRFYGGNWRRSIGPGKGIGVLYVNGFKNVVCDADYIDGFENIAVRYDNGITCETNTPYIRGHLPDFGVVSENISGGFYGMFAADCRNVKMTGVTGYRTRHLQDASRVINLTVTNCTGVRNHRPAFGCHNGTFDGTYNNVNVSGGFGGIQWRGFHLYVYGGNIYCPENNSAGIYDAEGGASDLKCNRIIKPSFVKVERSAVAIKASFGECYVEGIYESINGGFATVDFTGQYIGNVNVSASIKQTTNTGFALRQRANTGNAVEMGVFKVVNSTLKSDTNLIRMYAPAGTGSVWIQNNVFDSSAATFDIAINNAQNFERVDANFRPDGTPATRN